MRGPLWIELAKKAPDAFWLTHEKLLATLAKVRPHARALAFKKRLLGERLIRR
jgi:hypothetical protein